MSDKFKNKYRLETTRLKEWNYDNIGYYFVTICTKNKVPYFGSVINGKVRLSEIGKIAYDELKKTPDIRKDMNVKLGEYVIMPNHIHCIIIIGENEYNCRDAMHCVSTNKFGPQSKNLPSLIRGFKSAVTKCAKIINPDFSWQSRYYEHIIRNEKSLEKISEYIINNPLKWDMDEYYVQQN